MKNKYSDAAKAIETWITQQGLGPGERLPSSRALAKKIGFSEDTTARACHVLLAKETISRIGYKLIIPPLTSSTTSIEKAIFVVSYSEEFIRYARQILRERGVAHQEVLLSFVKNKNPIPALRRIFAQNPAGLIFKLPFWIDGLEAAFESEKTPFVICTDGIPPDLTLNGAGMDLYRGVEKAVSHLFDQGHRNIAHLMLHKSLSTELEIADYYRKICLHLGLKQSAANIWIPKYHSQEIVRETLLNQRKRHPEVTALFGISSTLTTIYSQLAPGELSLVGLYDHNDKFQKPLTKIGLSKEHDPTALWACSKIILDIQSLTLGRPIPPAQRALFIPDFLTDRLNPIRKPQADILKKTSSNTPQRIPAWETWRKTYVFLEKQNNKDENQWHSLDLTHLANHSMTRERGWLGADPLLHFSPGLRSVHEIPFEVIDGKKNSGQSVVTFKSPHTHSNKGTPLPSNVKLKLHKTVKALYFLHACGWVKWQEPFAEYIVHFKNGRTSKNPLIPVGSSRHPSHKQSTRLKPNIQDWWRSEEAQDFPHAMYAMVYNPAVPLEYERLLYTLEWINPHPKEEISFIEIEVDPNAGPTLALIAVTALL